MMSRENLIKSFEEKKAFVECLNNAFQLEPRKHSVQSVAYEVYSKLVNNEYVQNRMYYEEYLVVIFDGGKKSVRRASANSNTANFEELGKLINNSSYGDDITIYKEIAQTFTKEI